MSDQSAYSETPIIRVPDDYLIAIGRVSVHWGFLESIVDLMIGKLSGFQLYDPRAAIVTAHMTWPLKMDILESLVTALQPEHPHLAVFSAIKPHLKKAQEGRNKTAHGQWGLKDGKVVKLRYTARGKLKSEIEPVSLDDLARTLQDIHSAAAGLWKAILNIK